MSPSLPIASAVPWLVAGWIATVLVICVLIYLIARQVFNKTESQSMPEVLRALTPLLSAVIRPLAKLPIGSPADKELPSGQTGSTSAEPSEETS